MTNSNQAAGRAEPTAEPQDKRPTYIFVKRPRCPDCDSHELVSYASRDNGDGSRTRYSKCRCCGRRVVLVVE